MSIQQNSDSEQKKIALPVLDIEQENQSSSGAARDGQMLQAKMSETADEKKGSTPEFVFLDGVDSQSQPEKTGAFDRKYYQFCRDSIGQGYEYCCSHAGGEITNGGRGVCIDRDHPEWGPVV